MTLCSDSVADRRLGVPGPLRDRSRAETTHAQASWAGLERGEAVPSDSAQQQLQGNVAVQDMRAMLGSSFLMTLPAGHKATPEDAADSAILTDTASMPLGWRQGRSHVLHTQNDLRV